MVHAVKLRDCEVSVDIDVGFASVGAFVNTAVGSNVHVAGGDEHHFVHVGVHVDVCSGKVERIRRQLSLLVGT